MPRTLLSWSIAVALALGAWALVPDPRMARAIALSLLCLTLWLAEAVPPFVSGSIEPRMFDR